MDWTKAKVIRLGGLALTRKQSFCAEVIDCYAE
jgi:hypothetical protein